MKITDIRFGMLRVPLKTPFTWQDVHACVACVPTSANTLAWLKPCPLRKLGSVALWHVSQAVENPADAWLGEEVFW